MDFPEATASSRCQTRQDTGHCHNKLRVESSCKGNNTNGQSSPATTISSSYNEKIVLLSEAFGWETLAETDMRADTIPRLRTPLRRGLQRRAVSWSLTPCSSHRG